MKTTNYIANVTIKTIHSLIKIIEAYLAKLFEYNKKSAQYMEDLKANPHFRTREEMEREGPKSNKVVIPELKIGEVSLCITPDLGNQMPLVLEKWYVKVGDRVKSGDVLCAIGNEAVTMEFESFYNGKVIWICEHKKDLTVGDVFGKIEGI
ncbi:biotin/lipoyl-containing protein [uncultured Maribacter sp.]|uniref:biotin/lipoyl-containing protein n=1 Tax=uncultured Maribacter sp. TaxID=431308 RepID=UPI00260D2503|nr:biotin/lipoyl-containing protein [uncultured Maribacter sp.]